MDKKLDKKVVDRIARILAEDILDVMHDKFGEKFDCDFKDVERGNPLYVALCENKGDIKFAPFVFPRQEIAETFVSLCKKNLPGFKEKKFRIYKLFER